MLQNREEYAPDRREHASDPKQYGQHVPLAPFFCVTDRPDLDQVLQTVVHEWGPTQLLKQDKDTTVILVSLPLGAVVAKHHSLRRWRRVGDGIIHGSPARRSWQGACLLQEYGFCVPRPLAMLERRQAGMVRESLYVSEGLVSQVPLHIYWRDHHSVWSVFEQRQFLRAMADFLRAFHTAGLYAGDMRDANLFVEEIGNADWNFYLVDLDRVRHFPTLNVQRRFKNLIQLERTIGHSARASERLFFLYHYLGAPLPSRQQRRAVLRQLIRLRDKKDREYARRRARNRRRPLDTLPPAAVNSRPLGSADSPVPHPALSQRAAISCCIVCFNEEANIRRCLESVKWCDEIVVVDSFSTDHTVQICQQYTSRIIQRAWPGYVEQKRFALAQASHEWVLNVDADEEVSPDLQQEILGVLDRNDPAVDGFYIPRLVYYLGRWWWRGWYPGYRLRLFRKIKVRWGGVNPHEKVLLRGQADRLQGNIYHYTYDGITDHLRTINSLTDIASHELALRGKRASLLDVLLRPLWRFIRFYLLSGCIRDGKAGFFVSVTSAFYTFLKYAKLWEHNRHNTQNGHHTHKRQARHSAH